MNDLLERRTIKIPLGEIELKGDLALSAHAHALVVFAHGSGSSRLSPRNQMVANYLNEKGMGTLLFDLLTYEEDQVYNNRFDIPLLADRLKKVTRFLLKQHQKLAIGFFGASTGAAAALIAAAEMPEVAAVVSRGGRPDLAMASLVDVKAPTLLIVGGLDVQVIELNETAYHALSCEKKLEIVPGATHLFEEPGTMDRVCELAADWFEKHMEHVNIGD